MGLARRAVLLREALTPLAGELAPDEIERLVNALSVLVGVEGMIVLRDVLRLEHDEARSAGEWAVRRMVRAARETAGRGATPRRPPSAGCPRRSSSGPPGTSGTAS